MTIDIQLDVILAQRKMRSKELAQRMGVTEQSLSMLKTGKALGVRFETLNKICNILDCTPNDIIVFSKEG